MIDEKSRAVVEPQLHKGERLLWADRNRKTPYLLIAGVTAFFFIFFFGFTVQLGLAIIHNDPSSVRMTINDVKVDANTPMSTIYWAFLISSALLLVFLLMCVHFVVGRLKETYALTDKSGIVIRTLYPFHVVRIRENAFNHIVRTGDSDYGTLSFEQEGEHPFGIFVRNYRSHRVKFHNIADPISVEALIYKYFPTTIPEPSHE